MKHRLHSSLPLLSASLVLTVIWDMGYRVWSLESLFALIPALLVGGALSALTTRSQVLRMGAAGLLFFSLIDIFFIRNDWYAWLLLGFGTLTMMLVHSRLQIRFFVTFALIFAVGVGFRTSIKSDLRQSASHTPHSATDQILVHWVMDELGSFESVPEAYRIQTDVDEINDAYVKRGFRLHSNRPSISPDTFVSLGRMVEIDTAQQGKRNVSKLEGVDSYRIHRNSLHQLFVDKQWKVSITQSNYLDFCVSKQFDCRTYDIDNNAHVYGDAGLPWPNRGRVLYREILANLLKEPRGAVLMTTYLPPSMQAKLSIQSWRRPTLPLAMLNELEQQLEMIPSIQGKHYFFSHLLLPHFPWTLGRDCHVEPIDKWRTPYKARLNEESTERQAALVAYWSQAYCTHKRVLETIDKLDATYPGRLRFLIHGDHGPRIMARDLPNSTASETMDDQTRRNLLEPFIASRLRADTDVDLSTATQMQSVVQRLLVYEAGVGSNQGSW